MPETCKNQVPPESQENNQEGIPKKHILNERIKLNEIQKQTTGK